MAKMQQEEQPVGGHLEIRKVGLFVGFLLLLVRGYQKLLSPVFQAVFGPYAGCRFYPSCSHYTAEALREHGAIRGMLLGGWRILRCTPLSKGGSDPVPLRDRTAPSCVRR